VEVLFFGLGCQRFWQTVEVDLGGDAAIDRQNHFIAFLCWSAKQRQALLESNLPRNSRLETHRRR
jgi:hypothetical protein